MNLRILQKTFEEEGYDVLTARDVDEAQAVLMEQGRTIDLVLSDIQMPGKTGFDLVRWAKEHQEQLPEIPILLITSQLPEPENRIFGLSLGAVDYLVRSLDSREIVLRVHHAIAHFAQLRSLKASLEDSENLAAVGRFLAAANHEIRNLAQIAKTSTDILHTRLTNSKNLDDTNREALSAMKRTTDMLAEVSRTMGNLVGKAQPTAKAVNLDAEIRNVIGMIRPILTRCHLETGFGVVKDDRWVFANPTHLKQILINLLMNAQDAIREVSLPVGGHICLGVTTATEDCVLVSIKDNGVGLSSPETRTDFQAFSSTKQLRGGKGLGLWLSARFAEAMGGSLTLRSEGPGRGAEAILRLRSAKGISVMDISSFLND